MIKAGLIILLTLVVIVLFRFSARAQRTPPTGNNTLLWRITGHGLSKPSYLFGAMDYICAKDYFFTKTMQDCFSKADAICLSQNLSDPTLKTQMTEALTDNNKKLKDYFSPAEYETVKNYSKDHMQLDVDQPKIQALKPVAIQPFIIKQLLGCLTVNSYEMSIYALAQKQNKQVLGIETVADAMNTIEATHFNDKIAKVLVQMANGSTYFRDYRASMEQAYQQQDISHINTMFKETTWFSKADISIFLDEKNNRWMTKAPAMMQRSSVFFAVSPTNMWGDEGIINLLRKAGYTVEPVY